MESSPATHCHHVRTSGLRCGSLALRNKRYCYYHQRARPAMVNFAESNRNPILLSLPLFEDAHAIQVTLHRVVYHLLDGHIGQKTAGLLLYAMQIASSNLKHMKAETPGPEQVVVDLPKLSETPSPEPSEETARINSHTLRRAHFPYTPSARDEYYDDVMRQARELRENPAQVAEETFAPDLPPTLNDAVKSIDGKWSDRLSPEFRAKSENKSNDKLPPGTIHGCATGARRSNGNGGLVKTPSEGASSRP